MKKITSMLLCAATVLSLASCNKAEVKGDAFDCIVKTSEVTENSVKVSVEVNDAAAEYSLWVVEESAYKETVPETAKKLKGSAAETFEGLNADTEYYAVVYESTLGFTKKSFVTAKPSKEYKCLEGSDYIIIAMDETTSKKIESKIKYTMPSDGTYGEDGKSTGTLFFDWWNANGTEAGTCSGPNFFGVVDGWFSFAKTADGWFGYAFRLGEGNTDEEKAESANRREILKGITADYTLHLAMKATCAGEYSLGMLDGAAVIIGDETAAYGFKRDGDWHEIEIPMSAFMAGEKYNAETGVNVLYWTQGANGYPTTLDVDAIFWYKK